MAPPSGTASRPGRALATLAAIIVALFLVIVGGDIGNPGNWSSDFKVKLGLDLTSGTAVVLKAVAGPGHQVTPAAMTQAKQIMFNRVNGAGFTEAQVEQQGSNYITVSVPGGKSGTSNSVVDLVSTTAKMYFRQVLLVAPNAASAATPLPAPTPSGSIPPTAPATPSPSASGKASTAAPKASASSSAHAAGLPGAGAGRASEMAAGARGLGTAAGGHHKASASPLAQASPSASPSAVPTPTSVPSVPASHGTSTWQQAQGLPSLASAHTKALFNKLNCAAKDWKKRIGYGPAQWDNPATQIVSCGTLGGQPVKYALGASTVTGAMIKQGSVSAQPQQQTTFWQVVLDFNGEGTKLWGDLTTHLFNTYGTSSVNDQVAVVLDGVVKSAETVEGPITGGNTQITGSFSQQSATDLANVLAYGSLPLTFSQQSVQSISPQLGHDQLTAGLIAAAIGLALVVLYVMFYYRGLAIIAVSSLVIAALLAFEAVIVLGKYQHFALSLAGIAGLIVAIGITADSFVVFFERLRDEVREGGRSLRTAVEHGWARARRTILVSDTVSFLAAALLYYFAIGDVRGFAFTLGLTTVIDVLVVFTFTHPMMTLLARTKFFGGGHPLSGLDPVRLGARAPWRGTPRRAARPATASTSARPSQPKEA